MHTGEPRVQNHPVRSPTPTKKTFYYESLTCHASAPNMAKAVMTKHQTSDNNSTALLTSITIKASLLDHQQIDRLPIFLNIYTKQSRNGIFNLNLYKTTIVIYWTTQDLHGSFKKSADLAVSRISKEHRNLQTNS